ncbi:MULTISPECIES: FtsQ-type POTRA domain-containing protein [unclassified Exiguobacterium]|uniref:cell division protein FtsQ/DivIB n=1 Tax=unclassified Exiguobacterium TaxID=2644629 RepID=UPI001BEAEEA4|nr:MULTISPECIES: FtsQ-type POTRA domain-containing protein [unclassified Exiguobacterium]MDE0562376.1 FtsQ-type POTRA domain-containing protein [Exiguobacterium sp. B2(2022)]
MEPSQQTVRSLEDRIPYMKKQRRKKANRRMFSVLSLFGILILLVVYMQTSMSNVKEVNVSGLYWLDESYVFQDMELDTSTKFVSLSPSKMSDQMEKLPGVKRVDMDRSWYNVVHVNVTEEKMIAYARAETGDVVVLADGSLHPTGTITDPQKLKDGPLLREFNSEKELEKIASELEQVDDATRARMSEVILSKQEGEPTRYEIFMNDGNTLLTPTLKLSETVSKYGEIYENIPKGQQGTVVMDGGFYFVPYKKTNE